MCCLIFINSINQSCMRRNHSRARRTARSWSDTVQRRTNWAIYRSWYWYWYWADTVLANWELSGFVRVHVGRKYEVLSTAGEQEPPTCSLTVCNGSPAPHSLLCTYHTTHHTGCTSQYTPYCVQGTLHTTHYYSAYCVKDIAHQALLQCIVNYICIQRTTLLSSCRGASCFYQKCWVIPQKQKQKNTKK